MAFPTGWGRRQKIEINLNKIDSDLTSYTALLTRAAFSDEIVSPTDSNAAQADGGDIRFSLDAAGASPIDHDIILWGQDSVHGTPDAVVLVAVEVGSVASSGANTSFYVWYKTSGTDTAPDGTLAYDADWWGFWPLIADANDRVGGNAMTAGGTAALTYGGGTGIQSIPNTAFDGVDQHLKITNAGVTSPPCTSIVWADTSTPDATLCCISVGHSGRDYLGNSSAGSGLPFLLYDNTHSAQGTAGVHDLPTNQQFSLASTITTTNLTLFYNGSTASSTGPYTASSETVNDIWIGAISFGGGGRYWVGKLGLVQFHLAERGAAWIKAAYEEMADPANYWIAGAPSAPLSGAPINTVAPVISKVS